MREKGHFGVAALLTTLGIAAYFGLYFLCAAYVDVGSNTPVYLLQYRIGPVSLDRVGWFFEPARRLDDLFLRRRHALMLN